MKAESDTPLLPTGRAVGKQCCDPEAPFQAGQALACAAWDAAAGRWDTAGVAVGRTWTTGVQCFADRLGDFQPVYVPQAVAPVPGVPLCP